MSSNWICSYINICTPYINFIFEFVPNVDTDHTLSIPGYPFTSKGCVQFIHIHYPSHNRIILYSSFVAKTFVWWGNVLRKYRLQVCAAISFSQTWEILVHFMVTQQSILEYHYLTPLTLPVVKKYPHYHYGWHYYSIVHKEGVSILFTILLSLLFSLVILEVASWMIRFFQLSR